MTRRCLAFALAAVALGATVATDDAAVPDTTIRGWQDSAREALDITVLSVSSERHAQPVAGQPNCTQTRHEFLATAKVDVVHRSASGMQPGRTITLRHSALRTGPCAVPGGSFGDMLNGGDRAEAYLRQAGSADGAFITVHLKKLR